MQPKHKNCYCSGIVTANMIDKYKESVLHFLPMQVIMINKDISLAELLIKFDYLSIFKQIKAIFYYSCLRLESIYEKFTRKLTIFIQIQENNKSHAMEWFSFPKGLFLMGAENEKRTHKMGMSFSFGAVSTLDQIKWQHSIPSVHWVVQRGNGQISGNYLSLL